MNETAYLLGQDEPSSPSTKEIHDNPIQSLHKLVKVVLLAEFG